MIVFAHRGSSLVHPENTMEAFQAAIAEGADGIETDLRVTLDGRIVLIHDEVYLAPSGQRLTVSRSTLSALREGGEEPGVRVATLEELLSLAEGKIRLNLEVKERKALPLLGALLKPGADHLITSFDLSAVRLARQLFPALAAGVILERFGEREAALVMDGGFQTVSLAAEAYEEEAARVCRNAGAQLLLWVVNEPEEAKRFASVGVDGVFSDAPGKVLAALRTA